MKTETQRLPHVLLCVTGCVQAEVTPRLVANLIHHPEVGDHEVNVVATRPALQFFERAQVEQILGKKIFVDHADSTPEFEVPHISLAEWADVVLVYPASANTVAKCAYGFADSLVANLVMAARCPVYFGPTGNDLMFESHVVQHNLKLLKSHGYQFIPKQMIPVTIRATGETREKPYCSEVMVLSVVEELFSKKKPVRKRSSA